MSDVLSKEEYDALLSGVLLTIQGGNWDARGVVALKAHDAALREHLEAIHDMLPTNHKHDANGLHVEE